VFSILEASKKALKKGANKTWQSGTTIVIPNHRWTLDHTTQTVGHEANK
jgi:hypothetical protein